MSTRSPKVPAFFYGTAWKKEQTAPLTRLALEMGFRAIDVANQPRHYRESEVGEALRQAIQDGLVTREEIFLQTKFTPLGGHDHRIPYRPNADTRTQVRQSFRSSLENLGVERIDSYLLHGPTFHQGLGPQDLAAWETMHELCEEGLVGMVGVSNVSAEQLQEFCARGPTPPSFVQNRCFARTGWDATVRKVCSAHGVTYQGFSLLTANSRAMESATFQEIVERTGFTPAQVVFRFALELDMIALTGTTDPDHMREDLAVLDLTLSDQDVASLENLVEDDLRVL